MKKFKKMLNIGDKKEDNPKTPDAPLEAAAEVHVASLPDSGTQKEPLASEEMGIGETRNDTQVPAGASDLPAEEPVLTLKKTPAESTCVAPQASDGQKPGTEGVKPGQEDADKDTDAKPSVPSPRDDIVVPKLAIGNNDATPLVRVMDEHSATSEDVVQSAESLLSSEQEGVAPGGAAYQVEAEARSHEATEESLRDSPRGDTESEDSQSLVDRKSLASSSSAKLKGRRRKRQGNALPTLQDPSDKPGLLREIPQTAAGDVAADHIPASGDALPEDGNPNSANSPKARISSVSIRKNATNDVLIGEGSHAEDNGSKETVGISKDTGKRADHYVDPESALGSVAPEVVEGSEATFANRQMEKQKQELEADQERAGREQALQAQRSRVSRIHRRNRIQRENSIAADMSIDGRQILHRDGAPDNLVIHNGGVLRKRVLNGNDAVLRIQSAYRGRKVRKLERRQNISAVEIQRVYRGKKTRESVREASSRIKEVEEQEKERRARLQRIKMQERELLILRQLPAEEYLDYDRVRQTSSARLLQRTWRRVARGGKNTKGVSGTAEIQGVKTATASDAKIKREKESSQGNFVAKVTQRMQQDAELLRESGHRAKLRSDIAMQIDMDSIGLSELMERVKASASERQREEAIKERKDQPCKADGVRKKYQELYERRQMAAVMIESFQESAEQRARDQYDRLYTLGHTKLLLQELSSPHLPSLDQAKEMILNRRNNPVLEHKQDWVADLADFNIDALRVAARDHFDTCNTLTGAAKKKWSVVTSPHDVMEPPVDLLRLRETLDSRHRRVVDIGDLKQQRDKEKMESLYWVAFAAQRSQFDPATGVRVSRPSTGLSKLRRVDGALAPASKVLSKSGGIPINTAINPTSFEDLDVDEVNDWDEGKTPHELMGEVDSTSFLKELSVQVMQAQHHQRSAAVGLNKPILDDEESHFTAHMPAEIRKRDALAKRYIAEAASYRRMHRDQRKSLGMAKDEITRRDKAASRIQAISRGKRDRSKVKAIKAEQRVVMALQLLMAELGNPELKGKGKEIVGNLNVNISNADLRHQLQSIAAVRSTNPAQKSSVTQTQFGTLSHSHKPAVSISYSSPGASAVGLSHPAQRDVLNSILTQEDTSNHGNGRMTAQTNKGTPFSNNGNREAVLKPRHFSQQPPPREHDRAADTAFGVGPSSDDLFISTPTERGENASDGLFYQSPDSYGIGDDHFHDESADHIDRLQGQSADTSNRKIGAHFVSSTSLSGSESQPLTLSPGHTLRSHPGHSIVNLPGEDRLSPQSPLAVSPRGGKKQARDRFLKSGSTPGKNDILSEHHGLSTSDLHSDDLILSNSYSSPMKFLHRDDISNEHLLPRSSSKYVAETLGSSLDADEKKSLLRLKIPRVSKGVFGAMKRAADVVLNGGSPDIEAIVDDGMSFPINEFEKSVGLRILQDLVLVCGVLPLIEWLETYSTLSTIGPASITGTNIPRDTRDTLRYCYIPIDFACSLFAELGADLGIVSLRESPNGRMPQPNLSVREGQTQLVHMCVLLRLMAAGGEGDQGLPVADLRALLEDEWLSSTEPPETGRRTTAALAEIRSLLIGETARRGSPVCAATVFDECLNQWLLTLAHPSPDDAADIMMRPEDVVTIFECLIRNRRRARKLNGPHAALRPGDLVQYTYQLSKADAAALIQLCLWEGLASGSGSIPGSSSKSEVGLVDCVVSSQRLRAWICAHPIDSRSLQKKTQALMRAVPSSITALISESVVIAGSSPAHAGGARRHVTVSNFVRAVDRATNLPLTRAEAVSLGKLLLKPAHSSQDDTQSAVDDCFVDLSLLENIRTGNFL